MLNNHQEDYQILAYESRKHHHQDYLDQAQILQYQQIKDERDTSRRWAENLTEFSRPHTNGLKINKPKVSSQMFKPTRQGQFGMTRSGQQRIFEIKPFKEDTESRLKAPRKNERSEVIYIDSSSKNLNQIEICESNTSSKQKKVSLNCPLQQDTKYGKQHAINRLEDIDNKCATTRENQIHNINSKKKGSKCDVKDSDTPALKFSDADKFADDLNLYSITNNQINKMNARHNFNAKYISPFESSSIDFRESELNQFNAENSGQLAHRNQHLTQ
ncbi:hypothetical protein FGO68_gene4636 [Halteria grandinella]|uniref:Uncharacterized protein n=1 Tax=Halteria grandinella TaxID=5974 RepID=A0A8J8T195_HALGN|nr:hypothetical protein FGO68_gene4636 [Halteria grandinella]